MLQYYITMFSSEIHFSLFLMHNNARAVFLEWGRGTLPLRGQLEMSGDLFDCHDSGWGQVLASHGYAEYPRVHRTGPQHRMVWPQMSLGPRHRDPVFQELDLVIFSSAPRDLHF